MIDEANDNFKRKQQQLKKLPTYMLDDAIPTFNLLTPIPDSTLKSPDATQDPSTPNYVPKLDDPTLDPNPKSPFNDMTDSALEEVLSNVVKDHQNIAVVVSCMSSMINLNDTH